MPGLMGAALQNALAAILPGLVARLPGAFDAAAPVTVATGSGPEHLVPVDDPEHGRWLVTTTSDRTFWPWRRRSAAIELIPVEPDGAPRTRRSTRLELDPARFRLVGFDVTATSEPGTWRVHALNTRSRHARVEVFELSLVGPRIQHLPDRSEALRVEDARGRVHAIGRSVNAIAVLDDGRAVVSNLTRGGGGSRAWLLRHADGRWRFARYLTAGLANGVLAQGDALFLADYGSQTVTLARWDSEEPVREASWLFPDARPDNLTAGPNGTVLVAGQRRPWAAALHAFLPRPTSVEPRLYRLDPANDTAPVQALPVPVPEAATAVSAVLEVGCWYYLGQVRRRAVHACPMASAPQQ